MAALWWATGYELGAPGQLQGCRSRRQHPARGRARFLPEIPARQWLNLKTRGLYQPSASRTGGGVHSVKKTRSVSRSRLTKASEVKRPPISTDPTAQRAFRKLCQLGCDPETLWRKLFFLEATINPEHPLRVPYQKLKNLPRIHAKSHAVLDCNLDSWDDLLYGLTLADLRSMAKRAKKLEVQQSHI